MESFLGHPLLAGLPAAALQRTSRLRTWAGQWVGIDISLKAVELVNMRLTSPMDDLFYNRLFTALADIPRH